MIDQGALPQYPQVKILLEALPRWFRPKVVMKLELDLRQPTMFKCNELSKEVLEKRVNTEGLALMHSNGPHMALGVTLHSVLASILLL